MESIHTRLTGNVLPQNIGLFLHVLGICALKLRIKWRNEFFVLINFSVSEIILCINNIVEDRIGLNDYNEKRHNNTINSNGVQYNTVASAYIQVNTLTSYVAICEVALSLMLLTSDRLISVLFPFQYHNIIEKRLVLPKMIIASWFVSITASLLTLIPDNFLYTFMFGYVSLTMTIISFILLNILIVYFKSSRRSLQNVGKSEADKQGRFKKLLPFKFLCVVILFGLPLTIFIFYSLNTLYSNDLHILIIFESVRFYVTATYIFKCFHNIFVTKCEKTVEENIDQRDV